MVLIGSLTRSLSHTCSAKRVPSSAFQREAPESWWAEGKEEDDER